MEGGDAPQSPSANRLSPMLSVKLIGQSVAAWQILADEPSQLSDCLVSTFGRRLRSLWAWSCRNLRSCQCGGWRCLRWSSARWCCRPCSPGSWRRRRLVVSVVCAPYTQQPRWTPPLHSPFFTFLVHLGYPLRGHAVLLRYLAAVRSVSEQALGCWKIFDCWLRSLTASIRPLSVGDFSISASNTSSVSFRTYSRTVKKTKSLRLSPVSTSSPLALSHIK